MIRHSQEFCHLSMYELSDPDILQALAQAQARGVDVEVVVDATEPHTLATGIPFMRSHGIKWRELKISGGISHIKSLITEDRQGVHALMGGMNYGAYSWENHDASVYFSHATLGFETLFQQDYQRAGGFPESPTPVGEPVVYDQSIEPALLRAVSDATSSISIEAFAFTSRPLIAALESAMSRGVTVDVLLDPKQTYNRKTASTLAAAGAHVAFYAPYQGEYLHAKVVSIDHGRYVFVGSANFSYHGFFVNHEGDVELLNALPFGQAIDGDMQQQLARGVSVS